MSRTTEQKMIQAIREHFADEGIPMGEVSGVKVRALIHDGEIHRGASFRLVPNQLVKAALEAPPLPTIPQDMEVRSYGNG